MKKQVILCVLVGFAIGQLGWLDPLFVPLVLAGPLATGAIAAARRIPLRWAVLTWFVAGLTMLVSDEVVNHEDVAFHAVMSVVMALLAAGGWGLGHLVERRRRRAVPA